MVLQKIFETIKEHTDKIEYNRRNEFIKCLQNTKGTEKIVEKVREKGVPTHLIIGKGLEAFIPNDNRIRTFLTVVVLPGLETNEMFFYWYKEIDFFHQKLTVNT